MFLNNLAAAMTCNDRNTRLLTFFYLNKDATNLLFVFFKWFAICALNLRRVNFRNAK